MMNTLVKIVFFDQDKQEVQQSETVAKLVVRSNFDDLHSSSITKRLILGPSSRQNFKLL